MDEKELGLDQEEFDLDSILNEFHEDSGEEPESLRLEEDQDEDFASILSSFTNSPELAFAREKEEAPENAEEETSEGSESQAPEADEEEAFQEEAPAEDAQELPEEAEEAVYEEETSQEELPAEDEAVSEEEVPAEEGDEAAGYEEAPQAPYQPPLVYDPRARLRELKRKLVAGPEKKYYELSELGIGKLQVAIIINLVLVGLCVFSAVVFAAGRVPAGRMRFLIFSQVLAMMISGLLGLNLMMDGFTELFKGRFTINTMLTMTFLACLADAAFSLKDLRVPCCSAFCLEMAFALSARCQKRNTEMGQMDTLRKASRLLGIKKVPGYYQGETGFLREEGQLEDFWNNYQKSTGPQKLQSFYCFVSFLLCIGIAVLAGMLHGLSLAVQILATSMLVAVPASFFIALTRPAAILERRLHMVGAVFCGWTGIKGLCSKAAFPITDSDLFPQGAIKLNGVKFYSDRDPDLIVSYTASLIQEAGSSLTPIFDQLMNSRGVVPNSVYNFRIYENGGIGGEVGGTTVLMGSTEFLQSMGVHIPEGSQVSQAVYAAINGELCAVVAVSYAKMRSAAAGIVTLSGYRKLTPLFLGGDFIITENYVRSKFEVRTSRLKFPGAEERAELLSKQADPEAPAMALSTRPDLISFAYTVTGARALRSSCKAGMILNLLGGILGLLTMAALAVTGSAQLLTPINILLYQLVWLVPGFIITEWARHV